MACRACRACRTPPAAACTTRSTRGASTSALTHGHADAVTAAHTHHMQIFRRRRGRLHNGMRRGHAGECVGIAHALRLLYTHARDVMPLPSRCIDSREQEHTKRPKHFAGSLARHQRSVVPACVPATTPGPMPRLDTKPHEARSRMAQTPQHHFSSRIMQHFQNHAAATWEGGGAHEYALDMDAVRCVHTTQPQRTVVSLSSISCSTTGARAGTRGRPPPAVVEVVRCSFHAPSRDACVVLRLASALRARS